MKRIKITEETMSDLALPLDDISSETTKCKHVGIIGISDVLSLNGIGYRCPSCLATFRKILKFRYNWINPKTGEHEQWSGIFDTKEAADEWYTKYKDFHSKRGHDLIESQFESIEKITTT